MSELKNRWSEVGERIEALALKLKLHLSQADRPNDAADPLQRLKEQVSEAFDAAGNAVRDDAVKADVRETGRLFLEAMSASFAEAAQRLKERGEAPK
jgi:hypothetical protein